VVPDVVLDGPLNELADAAAHGVGAIGAGIDALRIVATAAIDEALQCRADEVLERPAAAAGPFVGGSMGEALIFND
jgi:hypothetical protein